MTHMNDTPSDIKRQSLLEEFEEILGLMQTAFQQGRTAHEVETGLWERILKLGHSVYGAWLGLFGDGDAGGRIVLDDGREVRRLDAYTVDPSKPTPDAVLDALFQEAPAGQPPSRPRPSTGRFRNTPGHVGARATLDMR
jgi:hypothetical protein